MFTPTLAIVSVSCLPLGFFPVALTSLCSWVHRFLEHCPVPSPVELPGVSSKDPWVVAEGQQKECWAELADLYSSCSPRLSLLIWEACRANT